MTDYACYIFPEAELYQLDLSDSFNDGLERFTGFAVADYQFDSQMIFVQLGANEGGWNTSTHDAYVFPEWSSNLFGHILVIPSRLSLGNVLSNQTRTLEIANLFLTPQDWEHLSTDVEGLTFLNPPPGLLLSPVEPFSIPAFGSYLLQVGIAADGPITIDGNIYLGFESEDVIVPVTGTRVVIFSFQPRPGVEETLEWKTDVMEAYDGTEQRAGLRKYPRQQFTYSVILSVKQDRVMRGLLFDWLPRVFAVPLWWEARRTTTPIAAGSLIVPVSTLYGDFEVGQLIMIWRTNEAFDSVEIVSFTDTEIVVASQLGHDYPAGTLIAPMRTAYSQTVPSAARIPNSYTEYTVEFTTISGSNRADATGQATYADKVLLDDCNLSVSAQADGFSRPVVVLDNETGRVFQSSRTDRSRYRTKKVWDASSQEELWRVRRLLHYFDGSRLSFFLPTFRDDAQVIETIGPSALTFRIANIGYTTFYQSRRPFADVRLIFTDGTSLIRRVIDSELADNGDEVLTISAAFRPTAITLDLIAGLQFVMLCRISDDKATIEHETLGSARITVNLISVKE